VDFALADSALMVALWNLIPGDDIPKVSGLKYLRGLNERADSCAAAASLSVMPTEPSVQRNVKWLNDHGVNVDPDHVYLALK
jgi:hypothetical protein